MLREFYQTHDSPEVKGGDIVIPRYSLDAMYLSQNGEMFCYMGMCNTGIDRVSFRVSFKSWPYYLVGKQTTQCKKQIRGLFRIKSGCILLTGFVDHDNYNDSYYKQLNNYIVKLPVPNSCYFGIEKRIGTTSSWYFEENEDLTRACFGLTYAELDYILNVYAERLGISNAYIHYPRITRSIKRENYCDLTGLWIPEGFPYIVFNDSTFSHVSLYGFYRHMGMLISMRKVTKVFEDDAENIVSLIKNIEDYFPFEVKVTREVIYPELFI